MASLKIYPRHVKALDLQFHFEDRESSSVNSIDQDFDYDTSEHVIRIEYRVKVSEWLDPQITRQVSDRAALGRQEIQDAFNEMLRDTLARHPEFDQTMFDQYMF